MATVRPFCYNPTHANIPGMENVGDISAGVGPVTIDPQYEWWNGPDEDPGYVIAYVDNSGDHPNGPERVLNINFVCHLGFHRTSTKSDYEFIELAKKVLNNFTLVTTQQAKLALNNAGYWTSYGALPPGMVLFLDAGDPNSYSGTGGTWYDLSGLSNHGIINGAVYSTQSGGEFDFNGTNNYISFMQVDEIPIGNEPYTISVWFNSDSLPADRGFVGWGAYGGINQVNAWRLRNNNGLTGFRHYWWGNDLDYDVPMTVGNWYHAVAAYENGSRKLYLNNVQVAQDTPSGHNVPYATNLTVGVTNNYEWFDGKIAQVIIYKRQATTQEISSIYNSGLIRFANQTNNLSGMYVNGFTGILGNSGEELSLRTFISNLGINDLTFYMGSLLNTPQNRTDMRSFVTLLHGDGQTRVFSNVTQESGCIDINNPGTEASYNAGSSPSEKFDGFTQEWEFWNSNNPYGSFGTFMTQDINIYNYCQSNNMIYDIYVSRCEDYAGTYTDQQVATHVVTYHDTIHLVAYISEATYYSNKGLSATRKAQLELIGNAAIALGKVQNVSILWAANGNTGINMYDFFSGGTLPPYDTGGPYVGPPNLDAFSGFLIEYNNWSSSAKAGINLVGQKVYAYSGLKSISWP